MIPSEYIPTIIIVLAIVNGITFFLFGFDKWMARSGGWRVPEAVLWICAAVGGSLGALAGMQFFRHKTKKLSFQLVVGLIILLQSLFIWYAFFYTT